MNYGVIKNNLKRLREATGKSQVEVANELEGFQKQTISKYENGYTIPPIDRLIDLANYYHVTLDDLVNEKLYFSNNNILLNSDTFKKYFSQELYEKDFSNILIKREMYMKDVDVNLGLIDQSDENSHPFIEYLSNHKWFEINDIYRLFDIEYERNLSNVVIHKTRKLLPLIEQIGIIYGLGGTYDFLKKPSSLSLEISDDFIVLCKLASRGKVDNNGNIVIDIKYQDLILSNLHDQYDISFKEEDLYSEIDKEISKLINSNYDVEFHNNDFNYPVEGYALLLHLKHYEDELPETYEKLCNQTNNYNSNMWNDLAFPFRKNIVESILKEVFPACFIFNVDYNVNVPNVIINGLKHNIKESTEIQSTESMINYVIAINYKKEFFEKKWRECLKEYLAQKNLTWLYDGVRSKGDLLMFGQNRSDEVYMRSFVEYVKSVWSAKNIRLLNAQTFRILKSIVCKALI